MKNYIFAAILSVYCIIGLLGLNATADAGMRAIYINGTRLSDQKALALQQAYGQVPPGRYWYDPVSGLWGVEGRPAAGLIHPGLNLGGPLRANASKGNTGVFVNGRRLPLQEFLYLQQLLGRLRPGRYWLDAQGYTGNEGGPALLNLRALARKRSRGGNWSYHSPYGGSVGGDGQGFSYYIDKDSSWTGGR
ncbi:MAG: hypothetical protein V3S39_07915 [Thermodesulfobacteriota bacterium]